MYFIDGRLEAIGSFGQDGVVGSTTGTGAGVYGINTTSSNYGTLGQNDYGVYGYSSSGNAGYFQGNAHITGNLTVDGTVTGNGVGDITGVIAGTGLSGGSSSGEAILNVNFAGSGSAATVSRSDHNHDADYASTSHNHNTTYYDQAYIDALESRILALETLLAHFTRSGNNIYITGANLYVRNGQNSTSSINGLGNLIIGYDESGSGAKNGSHNLVMGSYNNYSSYGGIVTGTANTISNSNASVIGGVGNTASGNSSSVTGGQGNIASGSYSSVNGGNSNTSAGISSAISGGDQKNIPATNVSGWCAGDIECPLN